jgi:hypothetical protein
MKKPPGMRTPALGQARSPQPPLRHTLSPVSSLGGSCVVTAQCAKDLSTVVRADRRTVCFESVGTAASARIGRTDAIKLWGAAMAGSWQPVTVGHAPNGTPGTYDSGTVRGVSVAMYSTVGMIGL